MKLLTLFVCLLMTPFFNFAQSDRLMIKILPSGLIDDVSIPTIQGGVEFPITQKITWYNEVGVRYRTAASEYVDTSFVSPRGFKAKTEFRYYFKGAPATGISSRFNGYYAAVNIYVIRDVHNTNTSYYYQKDSTDTRIDHYGIKKTVLGVNLVLGWQMPISPRSKRFMIDLYAGLGVRYKDVSNVSREYDYKRDEVVSTTDTTIEGMKQGFEAGDGLHVLPALTAGFRIGFRL